MQSIDLIELYECAYNSISSASDKEEIKCNIIKWYKKWLTLMMLQKKT